MSSALLSDTTTSLLSFSRLVYKRLLFGDLKGGEETINKLHRKGATSNDWTAKLRKGEPARMGRYRSQKKKTEEWEIEGGRKNAMLKGVSIRGRKLTRL